MLVAEIKSWICYQNLDIVFQHWKEFYLILIFWHYFHQNYSWKPLFAAVLGVILRTVETEHHVQCLSLTSLVGHYQRKLQDIR